MTDEKKERANELWRMLKGDLPYLSRADNPLNGEAQIGRTLYRVVTGDETFKREFRKLVDETYKRLKKEYDEL